MVLIQSLTKEVDSTISLFETFNEARIVEDFFSKQNVKIHITEYLEKVIKVIKNLETPLIINYHDASMYSQLEDTLKPNGTIETEYPEGSTYIVGVNPTGVFSINDYVEKIPVFRLIMFYNKLKAKLKEMNLDIQK